MKSLALALLISAATATAGAAAPIARPASGFVVRVDWQDPQSLPRAFRNHCRLDNFSGRPYCSDHCGGDQLYYCSQVSFGCCPLGRGYCDFDGHLRCHP